MKVLVADDNADNRQLIEDILIGLGHDTLVARDGLEALSQSLEQAPDLIVLDINMPGLSGFEVCQRLRDNPNTSQIPILMLTALADVDNRVKGLGLGADDYLTKPFSPRELIARIDARLRIKAHTDDLRATQEQIRKTFERFVPATVVEQLLEHPEEVRLGGQLKEITVMFADLQAFSSVSEHAAPETMLEVLNRYQELIVSHILEVEGTIDKFTGDGVMALFNTPLPQENHALQAVRAAVMIQRTLPTFHQDFEPVFQLKVNFGINTGEAVVGNVGTAQLMDYTAIGDTVNLASRLEDISTNGQILVSESTYRQIAPYVIAENLGPRLVKGRETEVTVYQIMELRS